MSLQGLWYHRIPKTKPNWAKKETKQKKVLLVLSCWHKPAKSNLYCGSPTHSALATEKHEMPRKAPYYEAQGLVQCILSITNIVVHSQNLHQHTHTHRNTATHTFSYTQTKRHTNTDLYIHTHSHRYGIENMSSNCDTHNCRHVQPYTHRHTDVTEWRKRKVRSVPILPGGPVKWGGVQIAPQSVHHCTLGDQVPEKSAGGRNETSLCYSVSVTSIKNKNNKQVRY